jgi:hypothetical protein
MTNDKSQEVVLDFIKQFENKSDDELGEIIRNYTDYQTSVLQAALILLERRGKISIKEKEVFLTCLKTEKEETNSSSNVTWCIVMLLGGIVISVVSYLLAKTVGFYIISIGLIVVGLKKIFSD